MKATSNDQTTISKPEIYSPIIAVLSRYLIIYRIYAKVTDMRARIAMQILFEMIVLMISFHFVARIIYLLTFFGTRTLFIESILDNIVFTPIHAPTDRYIL